MIDNPTGSDFGLPQVAADENTIQILFNIVFGVTGAIAVLLLIIVAINMIMGGNDPEKISRSKKGIYYIFIGLTIALSAEMIVYFVINRL